MTYAKKMKNPQLVKQATRLHTAFTRQLNDDFIFLAQIRPLLVRAPKAFKNKEKNALNPFLVPSSYAGDSEVGRSEAQLKEIYKKYQSHGMYEVFLVAAVAHFESFLSDLMVLFLSHNPLRSNVNVQGIALPKPFPIEQLVKQSSLEEALLITFKTQAESVFRAKPELYLQYMRELTSVDDIASAADFVEIAATRDLLVHNKALINTTYLEKAKAKARGKQGGSVVVDADYYAQSIRHMKIIAVTHRRKIIETFSDDDL